MVVGDHDFLEVPEGAEEGVLLVFLGLGRFLDGEGVVPETVVFAPVTSPSPPLMPLGRPSSSSA